MQLSGHRKFCGLNTESSWDLMRTESTYSLPLKIPVSPSFVLKVEQNAMRAERFLTVTYF